MLFNTQSACKSIEVVSTVIEHLEHEDAEDPLSDIDTHDILNELQNVVVQVAISRYFWPVRKNHELRAEHLRNAFGIKNENPLHSRELRDALEHFDERLDKYLCAGIAGTILPEYFGPLPESTAVPIHVFRAYYFDVGQFQLLDNRYEVPPIATEIIRLNRELERRDREGGRL